MNILSIIGGYLRTYRLRTKDFAAIQAGKPNEVNQYRAYAHYLPSTNYPWITLPRRDLVLPEQIISLQKASQKLKERSIDKIVEVLNEKKRTLSSLSELSEPLIPIINSFNEQVHLETGLHIWEFPPYLVKPLHENLMGIVLESYLFDPKKPILIEDRIFDYTDPAKRDLVELLSKPFEKSLLNHLYQLIKSNNPADLLNAQLLLNTKNKHLHGYAGENFLNHETRNLVQKIIGEKIPICRITNQKDTLLLQGTTRISETVWITDINDLDPIYYDALKKDSEKLKTRKLLICTKTINDLAPGLYGYSFLPLNERVDSIFIINGTVGQHSLKSTPAGIEYFNMSNEKRLQNHLSFCDRRLSDNDQHTAQTYLQTAIGCLEEMTKDSVIRDKDRNYKAELEKLSRIIYDLASEAKNELPKIEGFANNSLALDNNSKTQIAPFVWVCVEGNHTISIGDTKQLTTAKTRSLAVIYEGNVYHPVDNKIYENHLPSLKDNGLLVFITGLKDRVTITVLNKEGLAIKDFMNKVRLACLPGNNSYKKDAATMADQFSGNTNY